MRRIGIDLGGHTVAAALVTDENNGLPPRIERKMTGATPSGRHVRDVMEMMADISATLAETGAEGIGVAVPGMIDADRRHARRMPNFPAEEWDDLDIPAAFETALRSRGLHIPVKIENDANCYAYGEGSAGEAVGSPDYVVFTLGTGIGGGVVLGGKLISGFHGMAGEIGHIVVCGNAPCGCGGAGHVETLAAADGTSKRAAAKGLPEDFRDLWALRGEASADAALEPGLDALARAVATVCHMLDPEMVILGGGMSQAPGIREAVHERALIYLSRPFRDKLDLRVSKLGNEAAVYGAARI